MSGQPELRRADYGLSEDQEQLKKVFASFFGRACPATRVQEAEPGGFDRDLWTLLADMRALSMAVPEAAGGDGASLVELGIVAEELGRSLAPVPLIEAVVAARVLAAARGTPAGTLADLLSGERIATTALYPSAGPQLVPAAAVADWVIGLVDGRLVLTPAAGAPHPVANQGVTPLAWWEAANDAESVTLAEGDEAEAMFRRARREWKLLMAWALVGMAEGALALGVEHARSRVAFGAPIGSYQAVAHPLANVSMGVETARRLVSKASWYAEYAPSDAQHLTPMAFLYAEENAVEAARVAVHVLGGIGFTVESNAQLYFRRVKGWSLVAGDPQLDLGQIADHLFGPSEPAVR